MTIQNGSLIGYLSASKSLKGSLSNAKSLTGVITIPTKEVTRLITDIYEGPYEITPKAKDIQTLPTKNKTLTKDIVVNKVPVYEVTNTSGTTIFIAKEANYGE